MMMWRSKFEIMDTWNRKGAGRCAPTTVHPYYPLCLSNARLFAGLVHLQGHARRYLDVKVHLHLKVSAFCDKFMYRIESS